MLLRYFRRWTEWDFNWKFYFILTSSQIKIIIKLYLYNKMKIYWEKTYIFIHLFTWLWKNMLTGISRGMMEAPTLMKISALESPTLYFPSDTLIMGNWAGQEHLPRISRTWKNKGNNNFRAFWHVIMMHMWKEPTLSLSCFRKRLLFSHSNL